MRSRKMLAAAQWLSFAVAFYILVVMCRGIFGWLVGSVFLEPREDMAHGWFIPVFSIALFWIKRRELRAAAGDPSLAALLLAIPGVILFIIGELGEQVRFSHVGAIWLLWTALYAAWGRRLARVAAFPVAFLLFTMPLSFLDIFTVKLRLLIAAVATTLLGGIGIETVRVGTGLHCLAGGGFNLDIADPCSGMRSVFAMTAIAAGYAYLHQKTLRGKLLLFCCSIPLAMLGNLARIFSIAIVASAFGQQVATGFYHDYSGYVTFLVAILAMVALGDVFSRLFDRKTQPSPSAPSPNPEVRAEAEQNGGFAVALRLVLPLVLMPLILIATLNHVRHAPPRLQESDDFVAKSMPELESYTSRVPAFCQNEHCLNTFECEDEASIPEKCPKCGGAIGTRSLAEHDILPADTRILKGNYYDVLGNGWKVSVVVNGRSRQSIHRPEICLPAQGWSIEHGRVVSFPLADGDTLAMHCMDVRPRSSSSEYRMGHGYFFVNPRQRAASHLKRILISVHDRAFAGRVTRWAMVTVSSDAPLADTERRKEQTADFLSELLPKLFKE